jgi:hypothetical protein
MNYSGFMFDSTFQGCYSSVVEQLTHFLKVEASNPATAGTKIEKIARKNVLQHKPLVSIS